MTTLASPITPEAMAALARIAMEDGNLLPERLEGLFRNRVDAVVRSLAPSDRPAAGDLVVVVSSSSDSPGGLWCEVRIRNPGRYPRLLRGLAEAGLSKPAVAG